MPDLNEYDDIVREEAPVNSQEGNFGGLKVPGSIATEPSQPVEAAAEVNEYDDLVKADTGRVDFNTAQIAAKERDPEMAAKASKLAKEYSVESNVVENNMDMFDKEKEQDYDTLNRENPKVTKYLSNPDNAAISKDDVDNLKRVESIYKRLRPNEPDEDSYFGTFGKSVESGIEDLGSSALFLDAAYFGGSDETFQAISDLAIRKQKFLASKPDYMREFDEALDKEGGERAERWKQFKSSFGSLKEGKVLKFLKDYHAGGGGAVIETLQWVAAALSRPKAFTNSAAESLAFSLPSLGLGVAGGAAGAAAGSVAPVVGTVAGGFAGAGAGHFIGSAATETGAWINSELQSRGIDTTDPLQVKKAFENKKFIQSIIDQAERKGLTTAATDTLMTFVGGKFIKSGVGRGIRKTVVQGAKGTAVEVFGESFSEATGLLAAHKGDFSKLDFDDILFEGITSIGTSAITTAGVQTVLAPKKIKDKLTGGGGDAQETSTPEEGTPEESNEFTVLNQSIEDAIGEEGNLLSNESLDQIFEQARAELKQEVDANGNSERAKKLLKLASLDNTRNNPELFNKKFEAIKGEASKSQDLKENVESEEKENQRAKYSDNPVRAVEEIIEEKDIANDSLKELQTLAQTMKAVSESKTFERSPEKIKEMLDIENENVYFQKDDFDKFFEGQGESAVQVAEQLLAMESYNNAANGKEKIAVPMAEFISKFSGVEQYKDILALVAVKPDGHSAAEAISIISNLQNNLEVVAQEAQVLSEKEDVIEQGVKNIRASLSQMVRESGVDLQRIDIEPLIALYRTEAANRDEVISPEVFFKRFNIQLRKGTEQQFDNEFEQAEDIESENFINWFGDSKVSDDSGKPIVVYHGTKGDIKKFDDGALGATTNAASAKRGHFFTSSKNVATGYSILSGNRASLEGGIRSNELSAKMDEFDAPLLEQGYEAHKDYPNRISDKARRSLPADKIKEYFDIQIEYSIADDARFGRSLDEIKEDAKDSIENSEYKISTSLPADIKEVEGYKESYDPEIDGSKEDFEKMIQGTIESRQERLAEEIFTLENYYKPLNEKVQSLTKEDYKGSEDGASELTDESNVVETYLSIKNPYIHDFEGSPYRDETYNDIIKKAQEGGHDGVILKNTFDSAVNGAFDDMSKYEEMSDIYVVFDSTQVKSVNNNGAFDSSNPNIFNQEDIGGLTIARDEAIDVAKKAAAGELKVIGNGAENKVYDAGEFVAKVMVKKDYVAGKGNNKRFLIESVLEDNGISPKILKVETKSGKIVLLQKKEAVLEDYVASSVDSESDSARFNFMKQEGITQRIESLSNKIEALGFNPTDLTTSNLSISDNGDIKVIDAGVFSLKKERSNNVIKTITRRIKSDIEQSKKIHSGFLNSLEKGSDKYVAAKKRADARIDRLNDDLGVIENIKPIQGLSKKERDSAKEKIIVEGKEGQKEFFQSASYDRLERAKLLGFDTSKSVFHASDNEFDFFDNDKVNPGALGFGHYFADKFFESYGKNKKELFLRNPRPIRVDHKSIELVQVFKSLGLDTKKLDDIDFDSEGGDIYDQIITPYYESKGITLSQYVRNERTIQKQFTKELIQLGYTSLQITNEDFDVDYTIMFDPANIRSVDAQFDLGEEGSANIFNQSTIGPKGRIMFNDDKKFIIELFESADRSTFHHETAHYFLEMIGSMVRSENASSVMNENFEAIKEFLGSTDGNFTVEQHELFARSYEQYLREGKAPSRALRKAFNTFKVWLMQIYKSALQLNAPINDEMRNVFDRLLATDEEISSARSKIGDKPLFSNPIAEGMDKATAEKYLFAAADSELTGEEILFKRHFEQIEKEETSAWKKLIKAERELVESELNEQPVYKLLAHLRYGKEANGEALPLSTPRFKINAAWLKANYDQKLISKLPKSSYQKGGYDPEMIAVMYGFEDADAMVVAMANAPEKKELIKELADQRVREREGDPLDTDEISELALEAVHNTDRFKRIRMEYDLLAKNNKALDRKITQKIAARPKPDSEIKETARRHVDRLLIKEVKPNNFRLAERRYAKEAGIAKSKGDIEAAFLAKQNELLSSYLYKFAQEKKNNLKKDKDYLKRIFQPDDKIAKSRDIDFVLAARAILTRYGLGRSDKSALEHIEKLKQYQPETYENVSHLIKEMLNEPKHYTDLSVVDYEDMIDSIKALWGMAKEQQQIESKGKRFQVDQAAEEMIVQLEKVTKNKKFKEFNRTATRFEKFKDAFLGAEAKLARFEFVIDVLDGGKPGGPFRAYVYQPVSDAYDKYKEKSADYSKRIKEMLVPIVDKTDLNKQINATEINFKFKNKIELMGALLHTGNASNYKKLVVGYGWGSLDENGDVIDHKWKAFMDRMYAEGVITKEDMDVIQGLWDIMAEIKPDAQKAQKKMIGFFFNEIQADKVETPFGTYAGGYAPANIDMFENPDIQSKAEFEEVLGGSIKNPTPYGGGDGHRKNRTDVTRKLNLNLGLVGTHINDVLRYAYVKPAVVDAYKMISQKDVQAQLNDRNKHIIKDIFTPALNRADKDKKTLNEDVANGLIGNSMSRLKTLASIQIFFVNARNTLEQNFDLFSAKALMPKGAKLTRAYKDYLRSPKEITEQVNNLSVAMKTRDSRDLYEVQQFTHSIVEGMTRLDKLKQFGSENAFVTQIMMQNTIEKSIWMSSYEQFIADGLTQEQAVDQSDSIIRRSFGSKRAFDISSVESSAFLSFFQMFMGWFNTKYNSNKAAFQKVMVEDIGMTEKTKAFAYLYWMNFASIAMLSEALKKVFAGDLDEEGDGEYMDDILDILLWSQPRMLAAMVPVFGPMIQTGINITTDDKAFNDRMSASPALTMGVDAVTFPITFLQDIADGSIEDKKDTTLVKKGLGTLGFATGLPLVPLAKPYKYLRDVQDGNAEPSGPLDFMRGLLSGKPGD